MLLILAAIIKGAITAAQNILPDLLKNGVKAASIDEMILGVVGRLSREKR